VHILATQSNAVLNEFFFSVSKSPKSLKETELVLEFFNKKHGDLSNWLQTDTSCTLSDAAAEIPYGHSAMPSECRKL
jgi:hypothetical protein